MSRVSNGIALIKQAYSILSQDKRLLVFPLLGATASILSAALIWLGFLTLVIRYNANTQQLASTWPFYLCLALFYLFSYFFVIFFNSALAANVMMAFQGKTLPLKYGISMAWKNIKHIFAWSAVSASIGLLLNFLQKSSAKLSEMITINLIGGAWSVICYFVIPVLIIENIGPFDAIKRSGCLIKKTWGESLTSNFGLGILTLPMLLICLLPAVIGLHFLTPDFTFWGVLLSGILIFIFILVYSALSMILRCALYHYASSGQTVDGLDPNIMHEAFTSKQRTIFK
ncbi:MAG: hypothetical protein K0S08_1626 [Gammaproteobacteria bacterium]|jgi:hypothetical protein|nr:hypothetical protein [Gammaproteobacteria bacterium]